MSMLYSYQLGILEADLSRGFTLSPAPPQSHTFHEAQKHPLNSDVLILCSTVLELSGRSPVTLASLGMLRSIVKDWKKYHVIFLPPCGRIFDPMDSLFSSVMESRPDLDSWSRTKEWMPFYFIYLFIIIVEVSHSSSPPSPFPKSPLFPPCNPLLLGFFLGNGHVSLECQQNVTYQLAVRLSTSPILRLDKETHYEE